MKTIKSIFLAFIILLSSCLVLGCNNQSFNKSDWNEAFKVTYRITSDGYEEYYTITLEERYNQYLEIYHSADNIPWSAKIKKMFVKFEGYDCYVKFLLWDGMENNITLERLAISWVDYI